MVITTLQKHQLSPLQLKLTLEKTNIEQVHEQRVLGVIIDAEMKWQSHLNVCKIVSKKLFLLSQLRYYVNVKACKLFYSAHILSHKLCLHSVGWLQRSPPKKKKEFSSSPRSRTHFS